MSPRPSALAQALAREVIDAIAAGTHGDPFAILGPHHATLGKSKGVVLRAFHPEATAASIRRPGGRPHAMGRLHDDGFFEALLRGVGRDTLDYRLRFTMRDGSEVELDDPYRYGPLLTDFDTHLFAEGTHVRTFDRLGARVVTHGGRVGVHFAVWAPNARRVSVVGDFNRWNGRVHPMRALVPSGVWEIFIPDLAAGHRYKFELLTVQQQRVLKSDPYGRFFEVPPQTASIVHEEAYRWNDDVWLESRRSARRWSQRPFSTYEVHLGSWRRDSDGRSLSYRDLADTLVPYVRDLGFTHLELMPVMEHPFAGSWGYQVIGFFAPTSRFGSPEDFKYFVDACHRAGLGVILDWVPGHFPKDVHGLARFDGTALYEHADPRQGEHQDWGTLIFNYGRREVRSFLLSNALYWVEQFHIDALRVDAVASMLYLDYSRDAGQWVPNRYGGRENLEAMAFFHELSRLLEAEHPDVALIAEESTSWPGVSRPVHLGGLGFSFKWNMGWMHDMLDYCRQDPIYRKFHHNRITFSLFYAFSENFMLPFSHDEVVHGKRSLIDKMPGDLWQKHGNLRALLGYMFTHPGKKLLFMGAEIGQWREWNHDAQLDWDLLEHPLHAGLQSWVRALNHVYAEQPSLWEIDFDSRGFRWIDANDADNSVISFIRYGGQPEEWLIVVVNFTPVTRSDYRIGAPAGGAYVELLNSDAEPYGGSGVHNSAPILALEAPSHGFPFSLVLTLPPLGFLLLKRDATFLSDPVDDESRPVSPIS